MKDYNLIKFLFSVINNKKTSLICVIQIYASRGKK